MTPTDPTVDSKSAGGGKENSQAPKVIPDPKLSREEAAVKAYAAARRVLPSCDKCHVEYVEEYRGPCQEPLPPYDDPERTCPGTVDLRLEDQIAVAVEALSTPEVGEGERCGDCDGFCDEGGCVRKLGGSQPALTIYGGGELTPEDAEEIERLVKLAQEKAAPDCKPEPRCTCEGTGERIVSEPDGEAPERTYVAACPCTTQPQGRSDDWLLHLDRAAVAQEIQAFREAAATCWRYLTGEVVEGLRDGRHTPEVAANIAEHQAGLLLAAIERTGELSPSGHATGQFHVPTPHRAAPDSSKGER